MSPSQSLLLSQSPVHSVHKPVNGKLSPHGLPTYMISLFRGVGAGETVGAASQSTELTLFNHTPTSATSGEPFLTSQTCH